MKVALLLVAVFVAVSHQQYFHPRMLFGYPWFMMPFPQQRDDAYSNDFDSGNQDLHSDDSDGTMVGFIGSNRRHNLPLFDDLEDIPDVQSRVNGFNRYRNRPYYSNNDQKARFFFNFPNNGISSSFNNPLFKTAFFTSTVTLSLNSVQNCVPSTEAIANVAACRRRRRQYNYTTYNDEQFSIAPSETLKVTPTVLTSSQLRNLNSVISSSKDDSVSPEDALTLDHLREKRFFINKNQFVVTSYSTTFVFVNSTVTKTVHLLTTGAGVSLTNPVCSPDGAGTPKPNGCINCLPPGFVVCTAAAG